MATKEQERKALAQIMKIVQSVGGNDSYIGKAFEGCFEIAEDNILNDFWNSYKESLENVRKNMEFEILRAENLRKKNDELKKELDLAKETCQKEAERADEWVEKYRGMNIANTANCNKLREQEDKVEALQMEVIKLKARLFDMMVAQGA